MQNESKQTPDIPRDDRRWILGMSWVTGETIAGQGPRVPKWNDVEVVPATEVERLREALRFYADAANYEWRTPTREEAPDWSEEDFAASQSTGVLLDAGDRAREAIT